MLLSVAIAPTAIWFMPEKYRAVVVVAPVSDTSGGNLAGPLGCLFSQFGGLASIAGLSLSGDAKKWGKKRWRSCSRKLSRIVTYKRTIFFRFSTQANGTGNAMHWEETNDARSKPTLWKANKYFKEEPKSFFGQ